MADTCFNKKNENRVRGHSIELLVEDPPSLDYVHDLEAELASAKRKAALILEEVEKYEDDWYARHAKDSRYSPTAKAGPRKPSPPPLASMTKPLSDGQLVQDAGRKIIDQLVDLFQRDLRQRIVSSEISSALENEQQKYRSRTAFQAGSTLKASPAHTIGTLTLPGPSTAEKLLPAGEDHASRLPHFSKQSMSRSSAAPTPVSTMPNVPLSVSLQQRPDYKPTPPANDDDDDLSSLSSVSTVSSIGPKIVRADPPKILRAHTPMSEDDEKPVKKSLKKPPQRHKRAVLPRKPKKKLEITFTSSEDEVDIKDDNQAKSPSPQAKVAENADIYAGTESIVKVDEDEHVLADSRTDPLNAIEMVHLKPDEAHLEPPIAEVRLSVEPPEAAVAMPTPVSLDISVGPVLKRELSLEPASPDSHMKARPTKRAKVEGRRAKRIANLAAARARSKTTRGVARPPTPDPIALGLAEDDEDLFYLRLVLVKHKAGKGSVPIMLPEEEEGTVDVKHGSGCARTEGYYKIPQVEKLSYLAARNQAQVDTAGTTSSMAISRLARANARQLVSGLDKHKKATASDADVLQFNQLRTRKKQLRFSRSPIHDWGLYAVEYIPAGEMVIEYVGESIRAQVADKREKYYERQGIGSSYLLCVPLSPLPQ